MATHTVTKGERYKAKIRLEGFECWASNDEVADKFREVGFTDVVVTGSDSYREAEGTWDGEDNVSAEIPTQVTDIETV